MRRKLTLVPGCGSALMDESTVHRPKVGAQLVPTDGTARNRLDLQHPLRRDALVGVDPLPHGALRNPDASRKRGRGNPLPLEVGFQLHGPILATLVPKVNSALLDRRSPAAHGPAMAERNRPKPGEGIPDDVKIAEGKALAALWKQHARATKRTQEQFAEEMGFGQGNFSHYVGGRRPIPLDIGMALAKEMKCNLADFSPRLARELVERQNRRLEPWPFDNVHPSRVGKLTPGKRLQLEGILLDALDDLEEPSQPIPQAPASPRRKRS
jgi:hypothetical protein